jgi:Domain of unknown function (DUF4394)/Carboxypeptidase regulatory-like domain
MKKPLLIFSILTTVSFLSIFFVTWHTGAQSVGPSDNNSGRFRVAPKVKERILADQEGEACVLTDLSQIPTMRPSAGTIVYAYDFSRDHLVSFDASAPQTLITDVELTGLADGEFLTGIDFRPSEGALYAVVTSGFPSVSRAVKVNVNTGAVTRVNPTNTVQTLIDQFHGFDINSIDDQVRYVGNNGANRRINPGTGTLIGNDSSLRYAVGDVSFGATPRVVHVANSTSQSGTFTTIGVDSMANTLVRIGGVNGVPSTNGGELTTIGSLGIDPTNFGGMDIQPGSATALASLNINSTPTLVSIDLATGSATIIGRIGGDEVVVIDGLAIQTGPIVDPSPVPTPTPNATPTPGASPTPTATATPRTTPTPIPTPTPTPIPPNASTIRVVTIFGFPGSTQTIPFELLARGGEKSLKFSFRFNPSALTNPIVDVGTGVPAGTALLTDLSNVAEGYVGIEMLAPTPFLQGTRQIIRVTFTSPAGAPLGIFPLSYVATPIPFEIRDAGGNPLPWWFQEGYFISGSTAAGVDVSGRVMTPDGRGLRNAVVSITSIDGTRRVVTTSSFGYYRFNDVEAGGTYVVGVESKRYSFTSRVLNVQDTLTEVNFLAN